MSEFPPSSITERLSALPLPLATGDAIESAVRDLIAANLANPPLPGGGRTSDRWNCLARVGAIDLSLAKLYESHADALAILAGLEFSADPGQLHAVWAAEDPRAPLHFRDGRLSGTKSWCSGAATVEVGLVTATDGDGRSILARVALDPATVTVQTTTWRSFAMAAAGTTALRFDQTPAEAIGEPGSYLDRPGFWHGGAGIAAVWFGAIAALADRLSEALDGRDEPHALAHLGAIDVDLAATRALLHQSAAWIDAHPREDAYALAMRVRLATEATARNVLDRTSRALGPGPLATEPEFAQRRADLEMFIRQTHAERDAAGLGESRRGLHISPW